MILRPIVLVALPCLLCIAMAAVGLAPLVDTRLLGRPKNYNGSKAEWAQWKFVFKSYMGAVDQNLLTSMDTAEAQNSALDFNTYGPVAQQHARTLSYILSQVVTNGPLQIVMNAGPNGLEAWRTLVRQEEPASGASQVAELSLLLATRFSMRIETYVEELQKFEGHVIRYESQFSEILPDALHQALLKSNAPAAVKTQVDMASFTTASQLTSALMQYAQVQLTVAGRLEHPSGSGEAMDIGWVGTKGCKGKKGKESTKGNGKKGKGSTKKGVEKKGAKSDAKRFDGNCNNCGKYGHKSKECWAAKNKEVNEVAGQKAKAENKPSGEIGAVYGIRPETVPLAVEGWIFAVYVEVNHVVATSSEEIMMDSGAHVHVAPLDYGRQFELQQMVKDMQLYSVTGKQLRIYGMRAVVYDVMCEDGQVLTVTIWYVVADVRRPLVATQALVDKDFVIVLDKQSYMKKGNSKVNLIRRGNGVFLPVVMSSKATSAMQARSSGRAGFPLEGGSGEVSALDDLVQTAEQLPRPELPSDEAVRRHNLTHTPYADWCRYCVIGRGQESHHRRSQNEIDDATPVLAMDYCFLGTEEAAVAASSSSAAAASTAVGTASTTSEVATSLVIRDSLSSYCGASLVRTKGPVPYAVAFLSTYMDEIGYPRIQLQTDGEPAIVALARALIKDKSKDVKDIQTQISLRQSPPGSHASNGIAEAAVKNIEGLVRTMSSDIGDKYNTRVEANSAILGWIIRHAAWVQNRFVYKASGRTAFEELKMVKYISPVLQFGESVLARRSGVPDNRLSSAWISGLWLGRSSQTNEHIVGTSSGIVMARTVKAKPDEDRWCKAEFEMMVYPPWSQKDVKEVRELIDWTPTDGCQACEDDQAPVRRIGRPKKHTAACLQRQADMKKQRLYGGTLSLPVAAAPAARPDEATAAAPAAQADEQASEPAGDVAMKEVSKAVAASPVARSTPASSSSAAAAVASPDDGMAKKRPAEQQTEGQAKRPPRSSDVEINHIIAAVMVNEEKLNPSIGRDGRWEALLPPRCGCTSGGEQCLEHSIYGSRPPRCRHCIHPYEGLCQCDCFSCWGGDAMASRLRCAACGLKEAMVDFDTHFEKINVEVLGLRRFRSDPAAYAEDSTGLILSKHVDDGMMVGTKRAIDEYESKLSKHFMLKTSPYLEEGMEQEYLGRIIRRIPGGFTVRINPRLINDLLANMKLEGCKPTATPGIKAEARVVGEELLPTDEIPYLRGQRR